MRRETSLPVRGRLNHDDIRSRTRTCPLSRTRPCPPSGSCGCGRHRFHGNIAAARRGAVTRQSRHGAIGETRNRRNDDPGTWRTRPWWRRLSRRRRFRGGGGFHGGGGGFRAGGGFRGGGAAFHGGGFRGGGVAIHRGGFRAAPVFRGGGFRYSGIRHGGYRVAPYYRHHHRHHFHRRFYAPAYYNYPRYYAYPRRHCRVVWTHYGPRKICRYRPWLRHHHWRHRVIIPIGEAESLVPSWPGLSRPSTPSLLTPKNVDARDKPGHDE